MDSKLLPSSATAGFFQSPPILNNQFDDDNVLRSIADTYLHDHAQYEHVQTELLTFAKRVLEPDIFALIADAERNPPSLSTHSTFGVPRTTLHTSHGWRELQKIGIGAGIVAIPYQSNLDIIPSRVHQFLKYHVWTGSSAMVICPSAMTDGAATLLRRHLDDKTLDPQQRAVFAEAYRRLTSFDSNEAWTSGQWMTERAGGSDVRGTETVGTYTGPPPGMDAHNMPLGPWRVDGFKWFSSATDSQMTVLLAKTDKGGLSAFYAPMRKKLADGSTVMNGVSIQRLKPKLGTRALPTAELVLNDMRAWLIGKEGDGIREVSAILNITRIHNAIAALGHWSRALAISRAYARVRKVEGALLQDNPTYVRVLARNTVSYAAHMHLGFFVVKLLDNAEHAERTSASSVVSKEEIKASQSSASILRLLTPVAKSQCSKMAIYGVQECMESLGGIGYIEDEQEFNIARLFRDCNVLSIWEGTTDVMASDVVRVLKGRTEAATLQAYQNWIISNSGEWAIPEWQDVGVHITEAQNQLNTMASMDVAALRIHGRELLELLAWLTSSVLLLRQALIRRTGTARTIAREWIARKPCQAANVLTTTVENRSVAFGDDQTRSHKL